MGFSWQVSSAIAESLCKIFKEKTAIEWEKYLSSRGVVAVRIQSFQQWMQGNIDQVHTSPFYTHLVYNTLLIVKILQTRSRVLCRNLVYITLKLITDEDAKRAKISDSVQGLGDKRQVRISISCSPDPITDSKTPNDFFPHFFLIWSIWFLVI